MLRLAAQAVLVAALFAVPGAAARAQYHYPGGYSGWNGWGASTAGGSAARGMGVYAAGAGAYNEQTAEARNMNANTAMQVNDYMYAINTRNAQQYNQQLAAAIQETTVSADQTYRRLHDHPTGSDVHNGNALNVVLDELTNPAVYTQATQKATQPVASGLVKAINFQYAANMIAISLDDLSSRGVPDVLLTTPDFQSDRTALRALIEKARKESNGPSGQVSPETLAMCRVTIKALRTKVDTLLPQGSHDRAEADNFLKALYGVTKMLESPDVAQFLKGLNSMPTTTLGQLLTFMHSFNLRFGTSKTAEEGTAYDQLYPLLVGLRDQIQGQGPNPVTSPPALPSPKSLSTYFSGMHYNHFQPQPSPFTGAVPAPPQPDQPR